ncbi:MAG: hypothetical protein J6Q89_00405 [Clostridia bacterium]|nr:hypothetical protein [Clostridia bacterium]
MKKIIAILLVCFLAMSFVACGGGDEESNPTFSNTSNNESSKADTSKTESSKADSSAASSAAASSATSSEDPNAVQYTNKFISWGDYTETMRVNLRATDATSLRLSKINEPVVDKDNGVFTSAYGRTIESEGQDYANFAVAVFEYNHEKFSYLKTSFAKVGEADAKTAIPEDGFVVVVWKDNTDKINAIEAADDTKAFFPHGVTANNGLDAKIKAAKATPTMDGKIDAAEYGNVVWEIKPDNKLVSYVQFELNNYYATAEVYMTYDANNLYLGVIVDSPSHFNSCTEANKGDMYKFECIQFNLCAYGADSEYISENWDHVINATAANENMIRQYGFGVNNDGETLSHVWMPGGVTDGNYAAMCLRDDAAGKTYYEAVIGWDELGSEDKPFEAPVKGDEIGLSISINCGSDTSEFKNIFLRDGGGIIGLNDWTKIPTITLD